MGGFKTTVARGLRRIGAGGLVESKAVRQLFGAPIYKRMLKTEEATTADTHSRGTKATQSDVLEKPAPVAANSKESRDSAEALTGPKLSVIIPAYNVENYLEACVKSVLKQTYRNLQIIIVDDGSTDSSGAIANRLATTDRRVEVVHQENAGLGAARNSGLDVADGEYVTFIDSDDDIPSGAYKALVGSLESSGSGFSIGKITRFNSVKEWTPAWVEDVHSEKLVGAIAADVPEVLWDVFVCNKVFRREIWDTVVGKFPVGVLYEDQECTGKLYTQGIPFDILTDVVYRWRLRDDGSSITQNKSDVDDLRQRLGVARTVRTIIDACDSERLTDYWYGKLLCEDLFYYYREVPRAAPDFWHVLVEGVSEFFEGKDSNVLNAWPFERRLLALAAARADYRAFETVLLESLERGTSPAVVIEDGQVVYTLPSLTAFESPVPENLRAVATEDLKEIIEIDRVSYGEDGALELEGFAYISGMASSEDAQLRAYIVSTEIEGFSQATTFELPIRRTKSLSANARSQSAFVDYSNSGFIVSLSPSLVDEIAAVLLDHPERSGELKFDIVHGTLSRLLVPVTTVNYTGNARALHATSLSSQGNRVVPRHLHPGFGIEAIRPRFVASSAEIVGAELRVDVEALGFDSMSQSERRAYRELDLVISYGNDEISRCSLIRSKAPEHFKGRVALPSNLPLPDANYVELSVEVHSPGRFQSSIAVNDPTSIEISGTRLSLFSSEYGFLRLILQNQYATVEEVDMVGDSLVFRGCVYLHAGAVRQTTPSFALVGKSEDLRPDGVTYSEANGTYEVEFSMVRPDVDGRLATVPHQVYIFEILTATGRALPASVWPRRGRRLELGLPRRFDARNSRFIVAPTAKNHGIELRVGPGIESQMSGKMPQFTAAQECFGSDRKPVEEFALFESFGGRGVSDTPKRLDAYLAEVRPDIPRYWSVRDGSVAVPDGAIAITMYSREWFEKLSTAKWLINNNNFPFFFRKAPEQRYLQTWHGTPLKRIGNHVPSANLSLSYRRLMLREAEYWDGLVAQSPWAEPILADAFGFNGPMLTFGYPRNDALLLGELSEVRRIAVRRYLGIGDSQQAVLYAPTWRDDVKAANGHYEQTLYLDFSAVERRFGKDVVVIQRGHVNTANAPARRLPKNVIDANGYPDINDLYLAADLLVTDYSSVMFDFVLTRKPIIYLAPDIAHYRDVTRGFYFDFERVAPGPILKSTAEVIDAISELGRVNRKFDGNYRAFLRKFAPLDDGNAGERVGRSFFEF